MDTALENLAASVPAAVREACETLHHAGYLAYAVGGAVRDAMLGRNPGDWDVTTNALPEEVIDLFPKTHPTGIEHGTVTAMVGRGNQRMPIEITTFRGEGAYSDSRRPDSVTFGVSLTEDLARRDFVVNAMAFDPIESKLEDPFGGRADLKAKIVRAVGHAASRFNEDGLRVMRAIRFVAVLDFELHPATESALTEALDSLAKVAAERVRVELLKLLAGPAAIRALDIAHERGVAPVAVPVFADIEWSSARARCEALPADPILRLAGLLASLDLDTVDAGLRALTLSNQERTRIVTAIRGANSVSDDDIELSALRARLGAVGRERAADVAALWRVGGRSSLADRTDKILADGDALVAKELAISGKDVIEILSVTPGPEIGQAIKAALDHVHAVPEANTREQLTAFLLEHYRQ